MSAAHKTYESPKTSSAALDVEALRQDFPTLHQEVHGKPLVYLDNAATSQKPKQVIDAIVHYYNRDNSNVHRGVHLLSQRATESYEGARESIRRFINAESEKEIIYTRGCTEAINLVAQSYGGLVLKEGDEVLITWLEHHANIVPWQMICEKTGATVKAAPINEHGEIIVEEFQKLLSDKTKIVAFNHISNALGTVNPVRQLIDLAHKAGAVAVVDGAQAVPHERVDVQALGCDFYAFSGHKMYAPTGIGVLYGKRELLNKMPPYQGGGDMIDRVTIEKTTYNDLPYKFEAGTPHIEGAVGMAAAIEFMNGVGIDNIAAWEKELLEYGTQQLGAIDGLRIYGTAHEKTGVLSFNIDGTHAHDIGTILDMEGVAVRVGHHCAQTVMQHFDIASTVRASLAFYNTKEEIDRLVAALHKAIRMFK